MIFQHTIEHVLAGRKSQTSRIWKDDYFFPSDEYDRTIKDVVLSRKAWDAGNIRHLYRVGQELAAQPARGQKGVARIRILELAKRDVRDFTQDDIVREGFTDERGFIQVWASMHDRWLWKLAMRQTFDFYNAVRARPYEFYQALVIRFELVSEAIPA